MSFRRFYFFFLGASFFGASFLGGISLVGAFCVELPTGGVPGASWTAFKSPFTADAAAAPAATSIGGDAGVCGGVGDVTVGVVGGSDDVSAAGGGIVTVGLVSVLSTLLSPL